MGNGVNLANLTGEAEIHSIPDLTRIKVWPEVVEDPEADPAAPPVIEWWCQYENGIDGDLCEDEE